MKKKLIKINETDIERIVNKLLMINEIGANSSYPSQDSFSKKDLNNILMEIIGYLSNKGEEYSAKIVNQFRKKYTNAEINDISENHNDELYPDEWEPDPENDAFISTNGWTFQMSFAGKSLGEADEIDEALEIMRKAFKNSPHYRPTLWYVSDHGNARPIDLNGKDIEY